MNPVAIGLIVLVCIFGGALLGMFLRTVLPEHHLNDASKDVVKLVTGLIATLAALVLGLLVASAKNSFDTVNEGFRQSAAKIILLDRTLAQYGPETKDVRELLGRVSLHESINFFPKEAVRALDVGRHPGERPRWRAFSRGSARFRRRTTPSARCSRAPWN